MPHEVNPTITHRVLLIDDNAAIHEDFRKLVLPEQLAAHEPSAAEAALLGHPTPPHPPARRISWTLDSAMQGREGLELVKRALAEGLPYALAFVDMRMPPGWDGLKTIEEIWKVDAEIQIVVCSAHSDYDWREVSERLGNSDRLLILKKPADPIEILQCIAALVCKWKNARMLKRHVEGLEKTILERTLGLEAANRQLHYLASHDALTGLPNRLLLEDRLTHAIARAARDRRQFAVFIVDLDRFKPVNDSLGHHAGDELLREVARRLATAIRGSDTLARLGGDEFVVVTDFLDPAFADQIGQRMLTALQPGFSLTGVNVHISASIGVALFPSHGSTGQTLLSRADAAMYCAKKRGRNSIYFYTVDSSDDRVKLEEDLHRAVEEGQFELHYQPKVDTNTGEVRGVEALIRWRHPERGLLTPDIFIPLADECGLIARIGEWVVHEACRQGQAWQREGLKPLRIAVNLSPSQFRLTDLPNQIRRALDASGFEPTLLEVELTEGAVMSDPEESVEILAALRHMGVLVSVDDFGTGYSSMSYLRRFAIDKLKIDPEFIRDLATNSDGVSIVRAIVSLAHSLRLKVVAEGVETAEQLEILQSLGCDQYQGFHYSPAVPADECVRLLHKRATHEPAAHPET